MVISTKLYDILGVPPDVDAATLKKVFRAKAMKYHPDRLTSESLKDKQEGENKFKLISAAYEILSDPNKRHTYDICGDNADNYYENNCFCKTDNCFCGNNMDISDFVKNFIFRNRDMEQDYHPYKVKATHKQLIIDIKDIYTGCVKHEMYIIKCKCIKCNGLGASKKDIIDCNTCKGSGSIITVNRIGFMSTHQVSMCPDCKGKGKIIKKNCQCSNCNGLQYVLKNCTYDIEIKRGLLDRHIFEYPDEGDWDCDACIHSILRIEVIIDYGEYGFKRSGNNLIIKRSISLADALSGIHFGIKHLDNRIINLKHNKLIQSGDRLIIKNEGMPIIDSNDNLCGDLVVFLDVIYPDNRDININAAKYIKKGLIPDNPNTKSLNKIKIENIGTDSAQVDVVADIMHIYKKDIEHGIYDDDNAATTYTNNSSNNLKNKNIRDDEEQDGLYEMGVSECVPQ